MGSLNKVMLIGNLGRDPEVRYTQAGHPVANFPIATTERFTDRQGQRQERTEWHDIVAFDRFADLAQNYLKKGKSVYIEGRLQTRSWEDPQGQKRYRTEVVTTSMQFLDSRPSNEGSNQSYSSEPSQSMGSNQESSEATSGSENSQTGEKEDYIKDDIPF